MPVTDADLSHDPEHTGPLLKLVHAVVKEEDPGCWAVQQCAGCLLPRCTPELDKAELGALRMTVNDSGLQ